jgi:hypothetical protein
MADVGRGGDVLYLALIRLYVEARIHNLGLFASRRALQGVDVRLSEKKLPVEVALLDRVHVSHVHHTVLPSPDTHHCPVLEHLATDRPCPDQKVVERLEFTLEGFAENCNLALVAAKLLVDVFKLGGLKRCIGQHLPKDRGFSV